MTLRLLPLVLVLAAASALAGCSDGDDNTATTPGPGRWSVDDARAFEEFPLFWAGEEYAGNELTTIIRADYVSAERPGLTVYEDSASFLYGTCELPEGEGGCAVPYQLAIQTACSMVGRVSPAQFERGVVANGVTGDISRGYGQLMLWTQDVIITIFGPGGAAENSFASSLKPLNAKARLDGTDFPPAISITELNCPEP